MMNVWLIIQTDQVSQIIGKKFLGLNTDLNSAKQFANDLAPTVFDEYHVVEIDGIWCIEGREPGSDQMSYVGLYSLVKEG